MESRAHHNLHQSVAIAAITQNFNSCGYMLAEREKRAFKYAFISPSTFKLLSTSFCAFFLFLASRAKKASVMLLASPPLTFVLVAMQNRWFTLRRGTPLIAYGPVTKRSPLSSCLRKTTRRPRKRPASRISTVPGVMFLRSLVFVAALLSTLRAFILFFSKVLKVHFV